MAANAILPATTHRGACTSVTAHATVLFAALGHCRYLLNRADCLACAVAALALTRNTLAACAPYGLPGGPPETLEQAHQAISRAQALLVRLGVDATPVADPAADFHAWLSWSVDQHHDRLPHRLRAGGATSAPPSPGDPTAGCLLHEPRPVGSPPQRMSIGQRCREAGPAPGHH